MSQAKEPQGPPEAGQGKEGPSPRGAGENMALSTPDFRLEASITERINACCFR